MAYDVDFVVHHRLRAALGRVRSMEKIASRSGMNNTMRTVEGESEECDGTSGIQRLGK